MTSLALRQAFGTPLPRRRRKPPRQPSPRAAQLAYTKSLLALVDQASDEVLGVLLPQLDGLVTSVRIERGDSVQARYDGPFDWVTKILAQIRIQLTELRYTQPAEAASYTAARQAAEFNRRAIGRQLEAVLGVDPIRSEPYLDTAVRAFVRENVSLIRSITVDQHDEVERLLYRSIRAGLRVEDIQNEIRARYQVTRSRAALIAQDQIGKFDAELTQLRQTSVGLTHYTWDTSSDERVRPTHRALHGTVQAWASPPVVDGKGRRAHPGQDYRCRCKAIPVVPAELFVTL